MISVTLTSNDRALISRLAARHEWDNYVQLDGVLRNEALFAPSGEDVVMCDLEEDPEKRIDAALPVLYLTYGPIAGITLDSRVIRGIIHRSKPTSALFLAALCLANGISVFSPSSIPQSNYEPQSDTLTRREIEVLKLIALGLANKEIGSRLGVTERTVKYHNSQIFSKLDVVSRTEAVMEAMRIGAIPL